MIAKKKIKNQIISLNKCIKTQSKPNSIPTSGDSTLKAGCAAAHPDFLKNQWKNYFYMDVLSLNKIMNTLK